MGAERHRSTFYIQSSNKEEFNTTSKQEVIPFFELFNGGLKKNEEMVPEIHLASFEGKIVKYHGAHLSNLCERTGGKV